METELYNKIFARMYELGAIRKDLSLGCEIETCECNDWCCWIEDGVIGQKYWVCIWEKTSYIWAKFPINILSVKGHPPVLSDCIQWLCFVFKWEYDYEFSVYELVSKWYYKKPYLHQQSDELGEKLLLLLL